ncbi:HAD-like protein [Marasmius fiardii PR-910]|nr:HAD-like protein [Marasmius fiardii PR-910]
MSTPTTTNTFYADAVLFDMDGTLTDSISAVEAAWTKVANDIGQDPEYVIAATHGKRAIDNLRALKPHLKKVSSDVMDGEVQGFEESILFFADAYNKHGPGSRSGSAFANSLANSRSSSISGTPDLTPGSSAPSSRASSIVPSQTRRPSFASRLNSMLMTKMSVVPEGSDANVSIVGEYHRHFEDPEMDSEDHQDLIECKRGGGEKKSVHDALEAWQIEASAVNRSVRILPGVKRMIDSIPSGRYAVATSGAKTYAYGCMTRVGITPPSVTITADDKRLKAGKPAPDPFLLAADCLRFNAKRCVVFEDSPSGIRAGVASGATVIAVCTSHQKEKIEGCGAHYLVEDMRKVRCVWDQAVGKLKFDVDV